jgi:hypothetical protein
MATAINYVAVLMPVPVAVEMGVMAIPHLGFLVWLLAADRAMRRQRAIELQRFRELHRPIDNR